MNWFDSLTAFHAVAMENGFAKAARRLSLPNSVVTKRIQWLENKLTTSLFIRTTRQVNLTEMGEHLFKRVGPLLDAWHDLHDELLDLKTQPEGQLRVAFSPNLAQMPIFMELLNTFIVQNPKIELLITTASSPTNLVDTQTDILIAIDSYIAQPEITVRIPLFTYPYTCYASPQYLNTCEQPITETNLSNHRCLTYRNDRIWQLNGQAYELRKTHCFDTGDSILAACLSGMGLMYYPSFMAQALERDGQLINVFPNCTTKEETLCLYYTQQPYQTKKAHLFIELAKAQLKS